MLPDRDTGWKNRVTLLIKQWVEDNPGVLAQVKILANDCFREMGTRTDRLDLLAHQIQGYIEEDFLSNSPEDALSLSYEIYYDLVSQINWDALALHFMPDEESVTESSKKMPASFMPVVATMYGNGVLFTLPDGRDFLSQGDWRATLKDCWPGGCDVEDVEGLSDEYEQFFQEPYRPQVTESLDIEGLVEKIKADVLKDVQDGIVPPTVSSFTELHEYVDANTYGGLEGILGIFQDVDEHTEEGRERAWNTFCVEVNPALAKVDEWIKAGGIKEAKDGSQQVTELSIDKL